MRAAITHDLDLGRARRGAPGEQLAARPRPLQPGRGLGLRVTVTAELRGGGRARRGRGREQGARSPAGAAAAVPGRQDGRRPQGARSARALLLQAGEPGPRSRRRPCSTQGPGRASAQGPRPLRRLAPGVAPAQRGRRVQEAASPQPPSPACERGAAEAPAAAPTRTDAPAPLRGAVACGVLRSARGHLDLARLTQEGLGRGSRPPPPCFFIRLTVTEQVT